jgi:rRNA maturation RNase YbeY
MKAQINFNNSSKFNLNLNSDIKDWLGQVIQKHDYNYSEINYNFFTDDELLDINKIYLGHDFYTDIITFDNTIQDMISADIMISIDRVIDNAHKQQVDFKNELLRVMIHGVLHCMGYADNNEEAQAIMRRKENEALNMFHVEQNRTKTNV